jgi:hypothetical protein
MFAAANARRSDGHQHAPGAAMIAELHRMCDIANPPDDDDVRLS